MNERRTRISFGISHVLDGANLGPIGQARVAALLLLGAAVHGQHLAASILQHASELDRTFDAIEHAHLTEHRDRQVLSESLN